MDIFIIVIGFMITIKYFEVQVGCYIVTMLIFCVYFSWLS